MGVSVEPPNINTSGVEFGVHEGAIRYALAAVKGVGAQAAAGIVSARGAKPFTDLGDFARRLDPKLVNKRTLESLAQAGAFDDLEKNRAAVMAALEEVLAVAGRTQEDAARGQGGLFGNSAPEPIRARNVPQWLPGERLTREYEAIGFFLTGHPLDSYGPLLTRMKLQRWSEFSTAVRNGQTAGRLAATVLSRQEKRTKSGNRMGIIKLSDASGHYEAILFSEALAEYRDLLEPNTSIVVDLQASVDGEEVRARIARVQGLEEAAEKLSQNMQIFMRDTQPVEHIAKQLQKGDGDVSVVLMMDAGTEVEVKLPGRYRVSPNIAAAIKAVTGVVDVVNG
jgi:DNA polymerase-3 subunit alpha